MHAAAAMKVFVTRALPGGAIDRLAAEHEVEVWPERLPPPRDEMLAHVREVEGLLAMLTDRVDAELMDAAPNLRAISNYAVGVDNIDVEAATARGIPVGNTPGVLTDTTADLAVALMLGVARRLVDGDAYVRRGEWGTWEPDQLLGHDVHGATVGIVGFGRIGQAVARRLEGFECDGPAHERSGGVALEELLERSDFVSVHTPLTPETRGLIDAEALRRMKPTAYLVNTSRGPVVDTDALAAGAPRGRDRRRGAGRDRPRAAAGDHPLLDAPNLLVVPHLGSATHATRERMADMAVDNLLAGCAASGAPPGQPTMATYVLIHGAGDSGLVLAPGRGRAARAGATRWSPPDLPCDDELGRAVGRTPTRSSTPSASRTDLVVVGPVVRRVHRAAGVRPACRWTCWCWWPGWSRCRVSRRATGGPTPATQATREPASAG